MIVEETMTFRVVDGSVAFAIFVTFLVVLFRWWWKETE